MLALRLPVHAHQRSSSPAAIPATLPRLNVFTSHPLHSHGPSYPPFCVFAGLLSYSFAFECINIPFRRSTKLRTRLYLPYQAIPLIPAILGLTPVPRLWRCRRFANDAVRSSCILEGIDFVSPEGAVGYTRRGAALYSSPPLDLTAWGLGFK